MPELTGTPEAHGNSRRRGKDDLDLAKPSQDSSTPRNGRPMQISSDGGVVADAQHGNWVDRYAPEWLKPYARMARWDRPIGFWLLFWPWGIGKGPAAIA